MEPALSIVEFYSYIFNPDKNIRHLTYWQNIDFCKQLAYHYRDVIPHILYYIDQKIKVEFINFILLIDGLLIKHINKKEQTLELANCAINNNGSALGYIRVDLQTEEMCLKAIALNESTIYWVRPDIRKIINNILPLDLSCLNSV
jgi:hypothetical protein